MPLAQRTQARSLLLERKIEECRTNLYEFGRVFFPHYFKVESPWFHKELADVFEQAILSGDPKRIARAAPRDHAKSVWSTLILPIWVSVYGHKRYTLILSDTSDQADSFLMNIRSEFEDNPRLIEAFGLMQGAIWHQNKIRLTNGAQIQSFGSGKKLRGSRKKQDRPDLVIGDDIENDENVQSSDQRRKLKDWFFSAVMKTGDVRTTTYIVIGTVLHPNSLLADLLKNPGFNTRKYVAVTKFSPSKRWQEWRNIFINLANPNREFDAKAFFEMHRVEMLAGTEVLWPQWEGYYDLMVMRLTEGLSAFNKEKQNNPVNPDERIFHVDEEDPRHFFEYAELEEALYKGHMRIAGVCDPSLGKDLKKGDPSAVLVGALHMQTGQMYILHSDIQVRKPEKIIDAIIDQGQEYSMYSFGIEAVAFQEFFKDEVARRVQALGLQLHLPIVGIDNSVQKDLRIQTLEPLIKNYHIKFLRTQTTLMEQLNTYPTADHDDGPDALEMLVRLLRMSHGTLPTRDENSRKRKRRIMDSEW